jgi:hypothetical protein
VPNNQYLTSSPDNCINEEIEYFNFINGVESNEEDIQLVQNNRKINNDNNFNNGFNGNDFGFESIPSTSGVFINTSQSFVYKKL